MAAIFSSFTLRSASPDSSPPPLSSFQSSICFPLPRSHPSTLHTLSPPFSSAITAICCSLPTLPRPPELFQLLGRTLWGPGLPPGALVGAVRSAWTSAWMIMMKELAPIDHQGSYQRPNSQFRNRPPGPVSSSDLGRYHLYVALSCPWAHRTVILHALKGLEDAVPLSIAVPGTSGMWEFRPASASQSHAGAVLLPTSDRANQCQRLKDVYRLRKGGYNGRATVPLLWDSMLKEVVNNESADIIEILNSDFNDLARNPDRDLAPEHLRSEIEKWNSIIYPNINNGVYRCGFAQGQEAYESMVKDVFSTLDMLEEHLSSFRYLCGDHFTLADVRLFTTLFRFDPVYNILFKCSKRKLSEYPYLYGYLRDIYQMPGVASTCDLDAILHGYYQILFPLNPGGIQPITPSGSEQHSLLFPHGRELLSAAAKQPSFSAS